MKVFVTDKKNYYRKNTTHSFSVFQKRNRNISIAERCSNGMTEFLVHDMVFCGFGRNVVRLSRWSLLYFWLGQISQK